MNKNSSKNKGFTLVELIVAMSIFAFVSVFTASAIRNAVKHKGKINKSIDNQSLVRDALRIIEIDINKAFNYHDYHIDLYNLAQRERASRKEAKNRKAKSKKTKTTITEDNKDINQISKQNKLQEIPQRKQPKSLTHFKGDQNELHFTSLNNSKIRSKIPISDQAEVGYFLKNCRNRKNKNIRSNCLWRRLDNYLDDDVKEGGSSVVLIENVEEFILSYIGPETNSGDWTNHWDSTDSFSSKTKNKFPFAVKVKLKVKMGFNKKDKSLSMTMVAPIRFPNNDIKEINQDNTKNEKKTP